MTTRDNSARKERTLGDILADAAERRSAGDSPTADDYAGEHPELREDIAEHLGLMDLLASARPAGGSAGETNGPPSACLAAAVAELPEASQRVIYMRHIERLSWPEVARRLKMPEEDLRRRHASDLRWLIETCREWLNAS